ncbi:hypothetical protein SLEP1_g42672 [Rubroshorea leprosula]|uniref:Uncharacterized protein n=1 Tax=Rubroshorea leprosula TaxID=152421 RepID=A0AAV5LAM2_9ROSI|nr:hypothetical protein SLEP1_g42672 [Rubroshorea leprosula]
MKKKYREQRVSFASNREMKVVDDSIDDSGIKNYN